MAIILIGTALIHAAGVIASDVIVVANPKVAESSLSRDQLKAIFLGQMTVWPGGAPIEFVTLKESSDVHEAFLKTYLGRSTLQFNQYWKKQLFSGRSMMPKQFDSERKLLEYVSSTEGTVGYVSAGAGRGAAKILVID